MGQLPAEPAPSLPGVCEAGRATGMQRPSSSAAVPAELVVVETVKLPDIVIMTFFLYLIKQCLS